MVKFPEIEGRLAERLCEMAWIIARYQKSDDIEENLRDIRDLKTSLEVMRKQISEIESKLETEVIYTSECEDEPWWNK